MILKVKISTPKGMAGSNKNKFLKKILFSKGKIKQEIISKEKDSIIYIIDCNVRTMFKINKNIAAFQNMGKLLYSNKTASKHIRKLADSEEDHQTVKELISNSTTIEVLQS